MPGSARWAPMATAEPGKRGRTGPAKRVSLAASGPHIHHSLATLPTMASQPIRDLLEAGNEAFAGAAFCTGDFFEARSLMEQALALARAEEDEWSEAAATEGLGLLLHYNSITKRMRGSDVSAADVDAEDAFFRRALGIRRDLSDEPGAALPLFGLGLVEQVLRHDWGAAMGYFREALELVEAWGDAIDLYTQSEVHRHVGFYFAVEDVRPDEALRHLQRSLDLRVTLGDPRRIPSGLEALGEAELAVGNTARGLELLERAVAEARAVGLLPQRTEMIERTFEEAKASTSGGA
jgi:tetratricopeptide (TPR) repeat protein